MILWVSGFGVTKEEKQQGFRGNFARLNVAPVDGSKWTISCEKLEIPLAKHPQKEAAKPRHPNWGHPVLQAVEKGTVFDGIAIARAQLQALHLEFPEATIPGKDVVHVMIYNRRANPKAPMQKITLKVKPLSDGGAKLVLKTKSRRKNEPKPTTAIAVDAPQGKFTAMVKRRRKR